MTSAYRERRTKTVDEELGILLRSRPALEDAKLVPILRLVLERVYDMAFALEGRAVLNEHNTEIVAAIARTVDALGVDRVMEKVKHGT